MSIPQHKLHAPSSNPIPSSMKTTAFLCAATLALSPTLFANGNGAGPLFDGFSGGTNFGGWSYNPSDVIETSGGNPGSWLHQSFADTFAPIWISGNGVFEGDFRAKSVTSLSFDARTDGVTFGDGSGFQMSIVLRDTKGTANPSDDSLAYSVGPDIPLEGAGWVSYDFAIPSQSMDATPAGWTGQYAGGDDWNDVIQSVDRVEIWWIDPDFFALLQPWDIGLDNVTLHAPGSSVVRNGTGINPLGLTETNPAEIWGSWNTAIDIATPGAIAAYLVIGFGGPTSGFIFPEFGELLVLPPFRIFLNLGTLSLDIPADPSLIGACITAQGATLAPDFTITYNNALDVLIGG